jgi:hypothetical protein
MAPELLHMRKARRANELGFLVLISFAPQVSLPANVHHQAFFRAILAWEVIVEFFHKPTYWYPSATVGRSVRIVPGRNPLVFPSWIGIPYSAFSPAG